MIEPNLGNPHRIYSQGKRKIKPVLKQSINSQDPLNVVAESVGSQSTYSPQTTQFTDCRDAFSKYDDTSPVVKTRIGMKEKNHTRRIVAADVSPTRMARGTYSESLSEQSLHTAPMGYEALPFEIQKDQRSSERAQRKVSMDTFSFTNSECFELSQLREAHTKSSCTIQDSSFTDNQFNFRTSSISATSFMEEMELVSEEEDAKIEEEEGEEEEVAKSNRRHSIWKTMFLIIICSSLIVSSYFAIFGSSLSFQIYYSFLTDEQKHELAKYVSQTQVGEASAAEFSATALEVQKSPLDMSGVAYAPKGTNEPKCGFSREDALRDLAMVSTITQRIKTYGTQCHQMDHILYAIKRLGLDLKVSMGVWLGPDPFENEIQLLKAQHTLLKASTKHIDSVFIGHETLKRWDLNESTLLSHISNFKKFLIANAMDIPVGTSESPALVTQRLVNGCDVVGFTMLPFLEGISSSEAAQWTVKRFFELKKEFSNGKTAFAISEIGWPYQGGTFKRAEASPTDYHRFMYSWLQVESKRISEDWYCFEAFDEPWKARFNEAPEFWEAQWGIFDEKMNQKLNAVAVAAV